MKIGFTGTQKGMTGAQKQRLRALLSQASEFHHGDCIGADAEAHQIALEVGVPIVIHPPDVDAKRAFCQGGLVLPAKPYLVRNVDIVEASEMMVGTPKGFFEERRSGTWATIRAARRALRPVNIIFPDGSIE